MKQFKTREEVLQDAIDYYWGKPERKCVDDTKGNCQYMPSTTSEGCAIGRLLPEDIVDKLPPDAGVYDERVWTHLPEWLKAMGQEFLKDLQVLHDLSKFALKYERDVADRMETHVDMSKITFPS